MSSGRKIRPWPVFLLLLLFLVSVINIFTDRNARKRAAGSSHSLSNAERNGFSMLAMSLFSDGDSSDDTTVFTITPDRLSITLSCSGRFHRVDSEDHTLHLFWYRENEMRFADTLWLTSTDTTFTANHTISRTDTGAWSIDLSTKNNTLIRTRSFQINRRSVKEPSFY